MDSEIKVQSGKWRITKKNLLVRLCGGIVGCSSFMAWWWLLSSILMAERIAGARIFYFYFWRLLIVFSNFLAADRFSILTLYWFNRQQIVIQAPNQTALSVLTVMGMVSTKSKNKRIAAILVRLPCINALLG